MIDFSSKYNFIKSFQELSDLTDEEANTMLWILDMWDKKQQLPEPTDFKLNKITADIDIQECLICSSPFENKLQKQVSICGKCLRNNQKVEL